MVPGPTMHGFLSPGCCGLSSSLIRIKSSVHCWLEIIALPRDKSLNNRAAERYPGQLWFRLWGAVDWYPSILSQASRPALFSAFSSVLSAKNRAKGLEDGRAGNRIIKPFNAEATSVQRTRMQLFWKPSKPCHVGIHWIALTELSQMSTNLTGFQLFRSFYASFSIGQISYQQQKG